MPSHKGQYVTEGSHTEAFVQDLANSQSSLLAYITTLVGDVNEASNVLQQTNLTLWRKWADFSAGTSFIAWARRIAYYEVLTFIRDRARDRLVFDEQTIRSISASYSIEDEDESRLALRHCLGQLTDASSELLRLRYWSGDSIKAIATSKGRTEGAVKMALKRIREALLMCIQNQLEGEP